MPVPQIYQSSVKEMYLYCSYINDNNDWELIHFTDDYGPSATIGFGRWTYKGSGASDCENDLRDNVAKTLTLNSAQESSFIKVVPTISSWFGPRGAYAYGKISYFYPEYVRRQTTSSPIICNLKDILMGQTGANILADNPCFAHTVYSSRDLGTNADEWINLGLDTGVVMGNASFTYSYSNTDGVPSGIYYVIIAHFADGSTVMSDVMVK